MSTMNNITVTSDAEGAPTIEDEIVMDHTAVPFRFVRRRDRIYGFAFCLLLLVVTLSITLPLTISNDKQKNNVDWTMIGDPISNSNLTGDEVLAISLALSDDGQIIAIGNRHTAYVRVFEFQNQSWEQIGSDIVGIDESYGSDVALSGDGQMVAIGGPRHSRVQVFRLDETREWEMVGGSILGDIARGDLAGSAISLSLNGRIIAVGAHLNSDIMQRSGEVRVYKLSEDDSEWEQMGSDINGDAFGDQFGSALSLSNDGFTLAVGARFFDDVESNVTDTGHVRVYRYNGSDWSATGSDITGDEINEGFGYSVSMSGDGKTCAIGNTNSELAVYRQADTYEWMSIGNSIPSMLTSDKVFAYVSLSRDGNVLAVLENRSYLGESHHIVIVYRYNAEKSIWEQIGGTLRGSGLALSADGSIVAIGASNLEGLEIVRILTAP